MNNFSHGPVDVTSGIFYRPKDSKRTLLKSIFKNILRQLGVAYIDSCCGDEYDPNPIVTVTDPIHVVTGSQVGSAAASTVTNTLIHQSKSELNYYTSVSYNGVIYSGTRTLTYGIIPGYKLTHVSQSTWSATDTGFNVNSLAEDLFINSHNNEVSVPSTDIQVKLFLTYTKL